MTSFSEIKAIIIIHILIVAILVVIINIIFRFNMASSRKRASKSGSKSVVFCENGKARASNSTSINRFSALGENETHNCVICDDLVAETEFLFHCFTCSLPIHPCCIDADMPDDVIAYLCAGNAPSNFARYCHKCNRYPNNSMTFGCFKRVKWRLMTIRETFVFYWEFAQPWPYLSAYSTVVYMYEASFNCTIIVIITFNIYQY